LGHIITDNGIRMGHERIRDIADWPTPTRRKHVESFLGTVNYVSQFCPLLAPTAASLSELTGTTKKKNGKQEDKPFEWTIACEQAFRNIKEICKMNPVLRPINNELNEPIFLICDACLTGVGSWIGQGKDLEHVRPAAFHSRKVTKAQTTYPVYEQELLAIIDGLRTFRYNLLGTHFTVVTDHKGLVDFLGKKDLTPRLVRWQLEMSQYNFDVIYQPGVANTIADALSRAYEIEEIRNHPLVQDELYDTDNEESFSLDEHTVAQARAPNI